MAFKDYDEVEKQQSGLAALDLPFHGTVYSIKSPSARVGLRVQAYMDSAVEAARKLEKGEEVKLDDEAVSQAEELDLYRDVLGEAYPPMEENLTIAELKHAALTAMVWIAFDETRAKAVWEGKDLNALPKKSDAARTTQPPGSTNGMSPHRARNRNRRKTTNRSRGPRSSNGGRT